MTVRAPSRRRQAAAPPAGQADLFAPPPPSRETPAGTAQCDTPHPDTTQPDTSPLDTAQPAMPLSTTLPDVAEDLWARLSRSRFRTRFHLDTRDRAYLHRQGLHNVCEHAAEFIATRLAPAHPHKDGRQTPWRGHPVFVAQHATGTCCRGCIEKWHGFAKGRALEQAQCDYILAVIRGWLLREDPDSTACRQLSAPTARQRKP